MSKDATHITLHIEGSRVSQETVNGWQGEHYLLDGAARGTDKANPEFVVSDDAVLELELADGTHILVAAADAECYLGPVADRGAGQTGILHIGANLRFSGPRQPKGAARDSFGAWVVKGLHIFRQGPAAMVALTAAGTYQDAELEDHNGLYRCATDRWELTKVDALPSSDEPSLIFIHGTASSSAGSFQGLWENGYASQLAGLYGSRIYAFEHRSLTESPVANALALLRTLPTGAPVHLVSHSRGGIVGELLARSNRRYKEPITEDEIHRFLEHGKRTGRQGFEVDGKLLRELNEELRARRIQVERFARVACPARGTTLASGRLDRWATVMLNLFGKAVDATGTALPVLKPATKVYGLLKSFLLAVVRERTDARAIPGLEAMMPDSPLVALLAEPGVEVEPPLHVLAGDYQGDTLLSWLGDCLSEIFYGGETDLVVNTASMSGGAQRTGGIWEQRFVGREVKHTKYFNREASSKALISALKGDNSSFQRLAGPSQETISRDRGGIATKAKENGPIVYLLPGIMGSHLQVGSNRIWFEPLSMIGGGMERLSLGTDNVTADGWFDHYYEGLARYLADSHEVRPFVYDWRLSIAKAAERFAVKIDEGMTEAERRGKPLRIVAHSLGGLVARLALRGRWERFKAIPGSRFLQLGTPNNGSHSIAAVLLGRDDFVQNIERWCDWQHDMGEFLGIVAAFPGVLEMLPWPGENGLAADGVDYFTESTWTEWHKKDQDLRKNKCWQPPSQESLTAARNVIAELQKEEVDPQCSLYVAGFAETPIGVRFAVGELGLEKCQAGDGRVPWSTGIPPGVPVWYVDAQHGDLPNHQPVFAAYRELLEKGTTRVAGISSSPPVAAREIVTVFTARSLTSHGLYPNVGEVMAAAMGGASPSLKPGRRSDAPVMVEVIHGSLAWAESPVIVGSYADEGLRGSGKFLNGHLGGRLERAFNLGRYPRYPDEAMVFYHPEPQGKPAGAIVVGLGPLGELSPGDLTLALTNGLLEYVRNVEQRPGEATGSLAVSSLLVGTGFTGLTVEVGMRCLLDALRHANRALQHHDVPLRIGRLTIYEEVLDRAITAVQVLRQLVRETQFSEAVSFHGRLDNGHGGYRGRAVSSGGQPGIYRVHILGDKGPLKFTLVTDRARNEVSVESDQRQVVDGLLSAATRNTQDQPGLSRALFELLVPNDMKDAVAGLRTLMLSVDFKAAVYPWELMRDSESTEEPPLATRIELIRQLASVHGRGRVQTVQERRVLVVGDTQSGFQKLPGAVQEARDVAERFRQEQYEVRDIYEADAQEVFEALFDGRYRFVHLAGHGVVKGKGGNFTGMVLGPKIFLTSAQVSKMRRVPEFVFLNCCHLGSMAEDAEPRWGELAASLATQFIEMGCKSVIAAGWAVDDKAANTFACVFYENMLRGIRFGLAVQLARFETHRLHSSSNTWGAFQAYGDERYRFPGVEHDDPDFADEYVHPDHLIADLDLLTARLQCAPVESQQDFYLKQIKALEEVARRSYFQHGRVRVKFAEAWAALDDKERAIAHYRAALELEDAGINLHALEQLANLEIRRGAETIKARGKRKRGDEWLQVGLTRLQSLLAIAPTGERLTLLGSYWKRRLEIFQDKDQIEEMKTCVEKMTQAYREAAEFTHKRTGSWDYYSLLNALDSAFLSAVFGPSATFNDYSPKLPDLLAAAVENSRSRLVENRNFFHALAEVEVKRVNALYACFNGESKASIIKSNIQKELIDGYCSLMRRIGSAREHDSVLNHMQFLAATLPSKEKLPSKITTEAVKKGLKNVVSGIAKGLMS